MTKDTIFNMASMTKPVTSVAIMMLVDEGKLKLDDDVAKYLPKYKDPLVISKFNEADASYETRPAKRPITIRHLLTHTSGIGYGFASPMVTKIIAKTKKSELDLPLLFDPGESWAYGAEHSRARRCRRGDLRTEDRCVSRVAHPGTARHARHQLPGARGEVSRVSSRSTHAALTESSWSSRCRPRWQPPCKATAACTERPAITALFLRMLLNRGTLNGKRILSEKSVKTMFETHIRAPSS